MLLQGSLSIERMCQLVPVSRRSFYRSLKEQRPAEEVTEVRSVIQQIALEHRRRYGYRRITAELRRRGMQVNHKRVVRIMRKDNLLALQPKCFKVTTNSNHKFEIYLNLAARMKLSGINQLWVADITYIRRAPLQSRQHAGDFEPPRRGLGKTAWRQRGCHRHARPPPAPRPYPQMRAAELEDQVAGGTMNPKTSRKARTSTMEGPEKMQPRSSKRDFFELRRGNRPPPRNFMRLDLLEKRTAEYNI
jgi:HTH-like domain